MAKFLSPWNLLESQVPRHHNHHDCHKLLNLTLSLHHTMSLRQLKNFEHIADDWNDKRRCLLDTSEDECFSPHCHFIKCHASSSQASWHSWRWVLLWTSQRRRPWTFGLRAWQSWLWIFSLWHRWFGAHCSSPGWHVEDGYIVLNDTSKDHWKRMSHQASCRSSQDSVWH